MKKPLLLFLCCTACSLFAFSQTQKTEKVKKSGSQASTATSSAPLVQEIVWPLGANKTSVVVKPRPAVVTKLKL